MSETTALTKLPAEAPLPAKAVTYASTALAEMTDEEFELALGRVKKSIERQRRVMEEVLIEGVHYGNPRTDRGSLAFKKPILMLPGVDHLAETFRCTWGVGEQSDVEEVSATYVRVTIHRRLYDLRGNVIAQAEGTCVSHEKRFEKSYKGQSTGWTWGSDPRGALHDIRAMATKRCKVACVLDAFGLRGWLANEDDGAPDQQKSQPIVPWTREERQAVMGAALAQGITKEELQYIKERLFGDRQVGAEKDAADFLAHVKKMTPADVAAVRRAVNPPSPTPSDDEYEEFPRALEDVT